MASRKKFNFTAPENLIKTLRSIYTRQADATRPFDYAIWTLQDRLYLFSQRSQAHKLKLLDVIAIVVHSGGHCAYCGQFVGVSGHLDHITPLKTGGRNAVSNIVLSCATCNLTKNDRHIRDILTDDRELEDFYVRLANQVIFAQQIHAMPKTLYTVHKTWTGETNV